MKKRKGFTMVELMVVIIIMAILGLATLLSLFGGSDKAKYSRAWNDLNSIANAMTAYYGKYGNFPAITAGAFSASFGALTGTDAKNLQTFLATPMNKILDPWGNEYQVAGSWTVNTGKGYIVVYVKETVGTGVTATFGSRTVTAVKTDPYNSDAPMAKLVIDIP